MPDIELDDILRDLMGNPWEDAMMAGLEPEAAAQPTAIPPPPAGLEAESAAQRQDAHPPLHLEPVTPPPTVADQASINIQVTHASIPCSEIRAALQCIPDLSNRAVIIVICKCSH